jgi:hypothetical protein
MSLFSDAAEEIVGSRLSDQAKFNRLMEHLAETRPDIDARKLDLAFKMQRAIRSNGGLAKSPHVDPSQPAHTSKSAPPKYFGASKGESKEEVSFLSPKYFAPTVDLIAVLADAGATTNTIAAGILYRCCRVHDPKSFEAETREIAARYVKDGYTKGDAESIVTQMHQALAVAALKMPHWSDNFTQKVIADKRRRNPELRRISAEIRTLEADIRSRRDELNYERGIGYEPALFGPFNRQKITQMARMVQRREKTLKQLSRERDDVKNTLEINQYAAFTRYIRKNTGRFGDVGPMLIRLSECAIKAGNLEEENPRRARQAAREYLLLQAPLALSFGFGKLARHISEKALDFLHPEITGALKAVTETRQTYAFRREPPESALTKIFSENFPEDFITPEAVTFSGRTKQIHSQWQKLLQDGVDIEELAYERGVDLKDREEMAGLVEDVTRTRMFDRWGVRMVVDVDRVKEDAVKQPEKYTWLDLKKSPDEIEIAVCDKVFEHYRDSFVEVPGREKDYFRSPKSNNYKSRQHTLLVATSTGTVLPVEIQVRSKKMHEVAELGDAAHAEYKKGGIETPRRSKRAIKNGHADGGIIHIFTPEGQIFELPAGDGKEGSLPTTTDLAFYIRSDFGPRVKSAAASKSYLDWISAQEGKRPELAAVGLAASLIDGGYYELEIDTTSLNKALPMHVLDDTGQRVRTPRARDMIGRMYSRPTPRTEKQEPRLKS